jgi:hypothetical protein
MNPTQKGRTIILQSLSHEIRFRKEIKLRIHDSKLLTSYSLFSPGVSRHSNSQHFSPTRNFLQNCKWKIIYKISLALLITECVWRAIVWLFSMKFTWGRKIRGNRLSIFWEASKHPSGIIKNWNEKHYFSVFFHLDICLGNKNGNE